MATVALDLVDADWASARALIIGTGSYAGALVADLRARGTTQITIHSVSGRGSQFAASHQIAEAPDLTAALREADVVITCRGTGQHVITAENLPSPHPHHIVDLALEHDVAPDVAQLPHLKLITLADVERHADPETAKDLHRAQEIVREGLRAYRAALAGRALDPAVVQLRSSVQEMVSQEIARLPQHRPLSADDAAAALRRLAGRILHTPSHRAREAAEAGRSTEYLDAMAALYGIDVRSTTTQETV